MVGFLGGMLIGGFASWLLSSMLSPVTTPITHLIAGMVQSEIPDVSMLGELRWRKKISEVEYLGLMAANGFNEKHAKNMYWATERVMDISAAVVTKRRDYIDESTYKEIMRKNHVPDNQIETYESAMRYFPAPADVILWAAREVFEPEIREKLRLDEKLPSEFMKYARKAGMTDEMAKNYWAQHWNFPGWEVIKEMRHREIISDDDVDIYFHEADIVPFWRAALSEQMYRVYTRVDVRRMYRAGTLDREGVMRSYLDIGYDEEHAERMTDFTIKWVTEEPKTIAEGKIRQAYLDEKIPRQEASTMVISLGYDEESAEFIIALWDDDKAEEDLKESIDALSNQFLYLELSETEFSDKLDALNLPQTTRERIFKRTIKSKSRLMRMPTRADLTRWANSKIISPTQYEEEMGQIGYPHSMISRYKSEMENAGSDEFRLPTRSDLTRWLKADLINESKWHDFMRALGYAEPVIAIYAIESGITIPEGS